MGPTAGGPTTPVHGVLANQFDAAPVQPAVRGLEGRHAIATATATASNRAFTEWDQNSSDKRLCQAIVDRLMFEAHIVKTGTRSFRLAGTTAKRKELAEVGEGVGVYGQQTDSAGLTRVRTRPLRETHCRNCSTNATYPLLPWPAAAARSARAMKSLGSSELRPSASLSPTTWAIAVRWVSTVPSSAG